jgi:hypothetical protein
MLWKVPLTAYHAGIMHWRVSYGKYWLLAALVVMAQNLAAMAMAEAVPASSGTYNPGTHKSAPHLVVAGIGKGIVSLGGDWQFHLGDDMAWAAPDFDDSGWEQILVDRPWGAQAHYGYTGFAWYRRHVDFTPLQGVDSGVVLLLPTVHNACEVYWNGNLIARTGKLPPHPVWYYEIPQNTAGLGTTRSGVLAFRVWKAPFGSTESGENGGLEAAPLAGSAIAIDAFRESLDYRWLRANQYTFDMDILYVLVALLSFVGWLRNRQQKLLFWMALFSVTPVLVFVLSGLRLPLSAGWFWTLDNPVQSVGDIALWYLLLYLLELDRYPSLRRWTLRMAIVSIVFSLLDGPVWLFEWSIEHAGAAEIVDALLTLPYTLVEVFPLVLIGCALRKKLDASRWLVAISALLYQMIFVVRIAASQGERFTHWTLASKLTTPLFTLNGNQFTAGTLAGTFMLLCIVYGVYCYTARRNKEQHALEQEFKSAQELQRVLIPDSLPSLDGYAVTSAYHPAQKVGGDFFQLVAQPDGSALLILGDVSGKGLKAAMTVALIMGALRTLVEISDDPAAILAGLNRRLYGRLQNGFATCLAMRLDRDGSCVMANAGHLSPFLNREELELPGALPLGLDPAAEYDKTGVILAVGDRLTLYTDGLLEARNADGELFGFGRIRDLMAAHPDAEQASQTAVEFGQDDDITVLTLTRLAVGVESTTSLRAPALEPTLA